MDITILTRDTETGGVGVYTNHLIEFLISKGSRVTLIGPSNPHGDSIKFIPIKNFGKTFVTKEPYFFFVARFLLHKHGLQNSFIVSQFNFCSVGLKRVFDIKHTLHLAQSRAHAMGAFNLINMLGSLFHFLYSLFDLVAMRSALYVLFVSQNSFQVMNKKYSWLHGKSGSISNFIDTELVENSTSNGVHSTSEECFDILFVGRLEPLKGVREMVDGLDKNKEKLRSTIGAFRLHVVGGGVLHKQLEKYGFVVNHGKLPYKDVLCLYHQADLFLFLSLYENSPTVILEAMAAGSLILANSVGDIDYFLSHRKEQLLTTLTGWTDQLISLASLSPEEIDRIKQENKRRAQEEFSRKKVLGLLYDTITSFYESTNSHE